MNGPEGMRRTVGWLVDQYPDIHMVIEALVAHGDLVAVRVLSSGTNLSGTSTRWRATRSPSSTKPASHRTPARPRWAALPSTRSPSGSVSAWTTPA
jgi:hypothetical protein